jgi:hypothetical protein
VLPSATLKIAASACMKAAACINRPTSLLTLSFCLSHRVSQPHSRLHRKTLLLGLDAPRIDCNVSIAAFASSSASNYESTGIGSPPALNRIVFAARGSRGMLAAPASIYPKCPPTRSIPQQAISWDEDRSQTKVFFFCRP